MTPRSKTLVLALLLAGGAAAVWILFAGSAGRAVQADEHVVASPKARVELVDAAPEKAETTDAPAEEDAGRGTVAVVADPDPIAAPAWEEGFDALAVYGTVEDAETTPVAGAKLALYPRRGDYDELGPPLDEVESNADGRFRFLGLEELEDYRVFVKAEGYLPVLTTRRTGVDKEITLRPAAPFGGRVTDAATGEPLEGVEISFNGTRQTDEGLDRTTLAVTDAEGRYAFDYARVEGMQKVRIKRPAHMMEEREFQVQEGRPEGYDIELGAGVPLVVYVYDAETGAPVADREVQIASNVKVQTDAGGQAEIVSPDRKKLKEGKVYFYATLDGWCTTTRTVALPERGSMETIELPLVRGATVTGRVKNADGDAVADARVRVRNSNRRYEGLNLPSGTYVRSYNKEVRSDDAGRFEVRGVLPGSREVKVYASHDEYPREYSEPFYVASSRDAPEVDIELVKGARLEGRVTFNGEPIAAQVWWRLEKSSGNTRSNDAGTYRMRGVKPGVVKVGANEDDGWWDDGEHSEEVWVEDDSTTVHDVKIERKRMLITGIVRDSAGEPIAGAQVNGWAEDEGSGNGEWYYAEAKSEPDGTFALKVNDVPGLMYEIWAWRGSRNVSHEAVPVGTEGVELVMPELGKLRLEVVDAVTREQVQRFNIYYRESGVDEFRSLSQGGRYFSPGPDGFYDAELPVGTLDVRVCARSQGYLPSTLANIHVEEGAAPREARLALDKGVTVEFRFRGDPATAGQRPPRFTVVHDEQRAEIGEGSGGWNSFNSREVLNAQRMRPNEAGKATLKALAPGRYSFWKLSDKYELEPATFDVPPVDQHVVELSWKMKTKEKNEPKVDARSIELLSGLGYAGDG